MPATITNSTTASLMQTITRLSRAEARIPTIRTTVISSTMTIAGRFTEGLSPAIAVGSVIPASSSSDVK